MDTFRLLVVLLHLWVAQGAMSCDGEHQYVDEEGHCRMCELCPPGFEPKPYQCGFGTRDHLYGCQPCGEETFSTSTGYNFCRTCSPCARWNAELSVKCTKTYDAQCGVCFHGFYRPRKSDGNTDIECHKCASSLNPSCETTNWKHITVVVSVVCAALFIVVLISIVYLAVMRCRRRGNSSKGLSSIEASSNRSSMQEITKCSSSDALIGSFREPLDNNKNLGKEKSKAEMSNHNRGDEMTYSNLPTAQFEQSSVYPDLPTSQFVTPNFMNQARVIVMSENRGAHASSVNTLWEDHHVVDAFDTASVSKQSTTFDQM
ncbi:unnamed protein product [Clavelina lepadiformis]|uniref:TNFR-Cys domain-containing protein n=1 Tax=Clavelina lepadiformis TaxID=159417 RepID=A0ABP0FRU3_CLALP